MINRSSSHSILIERWNHACKLSLRRSLWMVIDPNTDVTTRWNGLVGSWCWSCTIAYRRRWSRRIQKMCYKLVQHDGCWGGNAEDGHLVSNRVRWKITSIKNCIMYAIARNARELHPKKKIIAACSFDLIPMHTSQEPVPIFWESWATRDLGEATHSRMKDDP